MHRDEPAHAIALDDELLVDVMGGANFLTVGDATYEYLGQHTEEDYNRGYACPCCGRPLAFSRWLRFHCDACDKSWADERGVLPNLESGLWKQVPHAEG